MTAASAVAFAKILVPIVYALLEYWLGKTNKTSSNSVVEFVLSLIIKKPQRKSDGMNTELKAFISMFFDMGNLVAMLVKDKGLNAEEEPAAIKILMEAPTTIAGAKAAFAELKALNAAGEADLIAFLGTELGVVNPKSAKIVIQSVNLLLAGYNLEQAITQPA